VIKSASEVVSADLSYVI